VAPSSGLHVLDANRPPTLELHRRHVRQRAYDQVPAVHDRMQIGARGAQPASTMNVPIELREALLPVPVDVVGARVTRLNGRGEKRLEQRVRRRSALEHVSRGRPSPSELAQRLAVAVAMLAELQYIGLQRAASRSVAT